MAFKLLQLCGGILRKSRIYVWEGYRSLPTSNVWPVSQAHWSHVRCSFSVLAVIWNELKYQAQYQFKPSCQLSSSPSTYGQLLLHLLFYQKYHFHTQLQTGAPSPSALLISALIQVSVAAPVLSTRVSKAHTRPGVDPLVASIWIQSWVFVVGNWIKLKSLIFNATPDGSGEGKEALRSALISPPEEPCCILGGRAVGNMHTHIHTHTHMHAWDTISASTLVDTHT